MDDRRLEKLAGIAAIAGIAIIFVANIQMGSPPKAEDPAGKALAFLVDKRNAVMLNAYLFGIAVMLLTFFGGVLRSTLKRAGDTSAFPDLVLAGTILVGAFDLVNVGIPAAIAFRAPLVTAPYAQAGLDVANIGFALLGIPFAVLFGSASLSAMKSRALPSWIVWLGFVTAVLNLLKPISMFASSGALAPNGALTLIPLAPIWVWTIAVGILFIKGSVRKSPAPESP